MYVIIGLVIGMLALLIVCVVRGLFRVEEGEIAVLTRFGAAVMEPGRHHRLKVYRPGLHFRWFWFHVERVIMKEQTLELTGRHGGLHALAADGTVLRIDCILRFAPAEDELHHFLFDLEEPLEHVKELFTCLLRNEIANINPRDPSRGPGGHIAYLPSSTGVSEDAGGGSYAILRSNRRPLSERIEAFCSQIGKRYGVKFEAVDITDILPPDELRDALNAIMHARAEVDVAFAHAQADSQRQIVAAERGVEVARARAKAVEEEIDGLGAPLVELERTGMLARYVARRRQEVLSQSRALYLRSAT